MKALGRPKVFLSLIAGIAAVAVGFIFFKGPLEVPGLAIDPIVTLNLGFFDYPLRSSVIQQWIAMVVVILIAYFATRRMEVVPGRLQTLMEFAIEGLLSLCEKAAGPVNGRRFFPVVATIFLFILGANWLGFLPGTGTVYMVVTGEEEIHHAEEIGEPLEEINLFVLDESGNVPIGGFEYTLDGEPLTDFNISGEDFEHHQTELEDQGLTAGHLVPVLRPANTDVNTPLAIALWSFVFVEFWGITTLGLFTYLGKFFNFKRLLRGNIGFGLIDIFVGLVELISELVRLVSFTFRLFGNVFAGEILIIMMSFFFPMMLVMGVFVMELFFGIIQAFIFAILTLIFGILAVSHHGDDEEHGAPEHGV